MAPKKSEAVIVTPQTILNGLSGDAAQQLVALTQLSAPAAAAFSQVDLIDSGLLHKLVSLLHQQDKSVKLLSCRLLAGYAAGAASLQQALCSVETLKALWSLLTSYQASEASITALLADPVAVKAAVAAKRSAGPDPEEWLPGPSKYLLEAALRAICSVISRDDLEQQEASAGDVPDGNNNSSYSTEQRLHCWAAEQDVVVLVCLLRHPSCRVQMRAARLAHQLCRSSHWADAFTAAGGVHAAVQLLGTFNNTAVSHRAADQSKLSSLLLAVVRLLLRAASLSAVAMVALTQEPQLLNVLMQQLLDSAAATTQGKAKVTAVAAATATTDLKLGASASTAVQQAAAELLAFLCGKSSSMSDALTQAGGLSALQQLLPEPPSWQLPGTAEAAAVDGAAVAAASKQMQNMVTATKSGAETVSPPGTTATPRAATNGTTASVPTTAAGTPRMTATAVDAAAANASGTQVGQSQRTVSGKLATATDFCSIPAGKLGAPELQASVLQVLAAVLSHEGAVQSLLTQPAAAQASLPRLLLYFFTPVSTGLAATDSISSSLAEAMLSQNADALNRSSAAAAVKATTNSSTGKGGGNTTARRSVIGSVTDQSPLTTTLAPVTSGTTPAQGLTPRKPLATPVKNQDPLSPPFPLVVKAAALECLTHLTRDKHAVAFLAEQKLASSRSSNRPETSAGDQQQTSSEVVSDEGVNMLQLLLQDLQLMACSKQPTTAEMLQPSNTASMGMTEGASGVQAPMMLCMDAAAAVLSGLAEHLSREQQQQLSLLPALKALAQCSMEHKSHVSLHAQQAVARSLLLLPEEVYVAPARPPLPSPPPTPPAPPLPTSQFAWDALGRPLMTDGAVLVSNACMYSM